jgi:hypothetical protein
LSRAGGEAAVFLETLYFSLATTLVLLPNRADERACVFVDLADFRALTFDNTRFEAI